MKPRKDLIKRFLATTEWANAIVTPLAGDASNRRYDRLYLTENNRTAVFMDAPPEKGEDVRPFVKIANYLRHQGLSAPEIIAQDEENGLLILEDLGDDLFARIMAENPEMERPLYEAATDVLLALHQVPIPEGLLDYNTNLMVEMSALSFDWYVDAVIGENQIQKQAFESAFSSLLLSIKPSKPVLIQRDYHGENLLWLPDRSGIARVGLLDFQDAMTGHRAYDLVSLMQDARREVSGTMASKMINRYIENSDVDEAAFKAAYHILGTQRILRILGVFTRLCIRDGKPNYIEMLPRVWAHLLGNLSHDSLAPISGLLLDALPEPTPDVMAKLKGLCK